MRRVPISRVFFRKILIKRSRNENIRSQSPLSQKITRSRTNLDIPRLPTLPRTDVAVLPLSIIAGRFSRKFKKFVPIFLKILIIGMYTKLTEVFEGCFPFIFRVFLALRITRHHRVTEWIYAFIIRCMQLTRQRTM